MKNNKNPVDAQGTTQEQAIGILEILLHDGYSSDIEELAVALGREPEHLENMLDGEQIIDDDLAMKMRGLAQERNIKIEKT